MHEQADQSGVPDLPAAPRGRGPGPGGEQRQQRAREGEPQGEDVNGSAYGSPYFAPTKPVLQSSTNTAGAARTASPRTPSAPGAHGG